LGHKKEENQKTRESRAIALNIGMRGDIADVIIRVKFSINRLGGFGVLTRQLSHSSHA